MDKCWRINLDLESKPARCSEYDPMCIYLESGEVCPMGETIVL